MAPAPTKEIKGAKAFLKNHTITRIARITNFQLVLKYGLEIHRLNHQNVSI